MSLVDEIATPPAAVVVTPSMLRGHDVICFSSIDWDFLWQGHQEIMSMLAANGNRVLFIENTGVRTPGLQDLSRLWQRISNWRRSTKGFREVQPNLFVYTPIIFPFPYSRSVRGINQYLLLGAIHRWARATGFSRIIVWTFLPTPLVRGVIRKLVPTLTIYHCADDLASSSTQAMKIRPSEEQLFQEADLVFVTSEKLRERAAHFSQRVSLFPSGVDFNRFATIRQSADSLPSDLSQVVGPIAGYVGGIHRWVDQELLVSVAKRMPHMTFALIGPVQTNVSRLASCPNVRFLGARSRKEIPAYLKGCRVGLIPYRLSHYTAHVYPAKLNEYLAMGIPVVATKLPEVERFNAQYGEVVTIGGTTDDFVSAITRALQDDTPEAVQRRIDVARQNSWEARLGDMAAVILAALDAKRGTGIRWQDSLRRLYQRARQRLSVAIVTVLLLYGVLFQSYLPWVMARPLHVAQQPQPADAIVVFAGGVGETGKAGGGNSYQERVKQAIDLYQSGMAPVMIFSSGYTQIFHETQVMKDVAISIGVPPERILLETQAVTTYENVHYVQQILAAHGWRRILLVSSPYHMRRALLVFAKAAPEIHVTPTPVHQSQFYMHERGANLQQLQAVLHEYLAIVYYWWKGWI